jgi:hypothetical protein
MKKYSTEKFPRVKKLTRAKKVKPSGEANLSSTEKTFPVYFEEQPIYPNFYGNLNLG